MDIVYKSFFPFSGNCISVVWFGKIYARNENKPLPKDVIRSEKIHAAQAKDLGSWWKFHLLYAWYRIRYGYAKNPFELEVSDYRYREDYLMKREKFAWKKYFI